MSRLLHITSSPLRIKSFLQRPSSRNNWCFCLIASYIVLFWERCILDLMKLCSIYSFILGIAVNLIFLPIIKFLLLLLVIALRGWWYISGLNSGWYLCVTYNIVIDLWLLFKIYLLCNVIWAWILLLLLLLLGPIRLILILSISYAVLIHAGGDGSRRFSFVNKL